jgi:hypothetical protein
MPRTRLSSRVWAPPLLAVGLILWRLVLPERSLEAVGPRALADALFAIGLMLLILYTARGLGGIVLRLLAVAPLDPSLLLVFSLAGGLGSLAYGVLALGLVGLLTPPVVFLWLAAAAVLAWRETITHGRDWADPWQPFRSLSPGLRAGLVVALAVFGMSLMQALSPVWDYDGLMYHLQGPALFLQAGRLILLPDLWQANGPLLTEMLYLIGLAAGSEVFSKVLHLAMAAMLVLSTFAVGRRHLGDRGGWLAAGILLGVSILPVWGSLAYADMAWALYELLALAAFLEWRRSPRRTWLVVSGGLLGWAMGSKYTALALFPIMLLAILVDPQAGHGVQRIRSALWLGGTSLIVASPWYIKNLIWAGNPIYPFFFGGTGWPPARLDMLMAYLGSFGTGRSLIDTFLLPVSLFTQRAAFGTFMSRIDIPSLLFLLALAFPFLRRDHPLRPLGWMMLLRFALWAVGTQQTRFLLPLYPVLSLLAASVLDAWLATPYASRIGRVAVSGAVGGLMAVTLAYQVIYFVSTRPDRVVLGSETKDSFLERSVYDYAVMRYIRGSLEPTDRVFMAWDGQGFRCDERCLPDAEQSQWVQLAASADTTQAVTEALRDLGVTHLLVDLEGMNFMLLHDPTGLHAAAAAMLTHEYAPVCLEVVVGTEKAQLLRLTCE